MAVSAQIVYQPYHAQPYHAGKRGALKAGSAVACRSFEEGMLRAEKALDGGSIVGARVVRVLHDSEADEFGDPEYLGQVGRVPEEI